MTPADRLSKTARAAALTYLDRVDAAAPGLVTGLHVLGSAVLDDYRPGRSDLDVVLEVAREPDDDELAVVADDGVDGVCVPEGALAGAPDDIATAPWVRDGKPHRERSNALHPVTWLQLARYSETLRGERPSAHVDVPAAVSHCRADLRRYWAPLLERTAEALAERGPTGSVRIEGALWIGLGPGRLWHTIRTGEIIGKSRAGELVAHRWPDLATELLDLVAIRAGAPITVTMTHGHAAVEAGRRVLADSGVPDPA